MHNNPTKTNEPLLDYGSIQQPTTAPADGIGGKDKHSAGALCLIALSVLFSALFFPFVACCCTLVVAEYERLVVLRCGKSRSGNQSMAPGIYFILPFVDVPHKIDLRTRALAVKPQKILTRDSLTVEVDAVIYRRVCDPLKTVMNVNGAEKATNLLASVTLRNTLGTKDLAEILSDREGIALALKKHIGATTARWGIEVERVDIRDIILPETMQRAMAAEAEAKCEASAKIISAQGEQDAAAALSGAANDLGAAPGALQLRFFQTLHSISAEKNSTIVLPFPVDLITRAATNPQASGGGSAV